MDAEPVVWKDSLWIKEGDYPRVTLPVTGQI